MRLGRISSTAPLRVRLNGDTADAPAEGYAGLAPALDQEVLVLTVEGRRLIVWAA